MKSPKSYGGILIIEKSVVTDSYVRPEICVETGEYYHSQLAAEKANGYGGIHKVCLGKQYTVGGYHWRYA